ncbi:hypothetical protein scyTo_0021795, partial [Scyliorhinus torazame]|nr:hypothetical protein [Scyliorhinus torazame]
MTSIHLCLAALIVLIFTLAIAIGLRVHAVSVNKECDHANLCNDTSNEAQLTDLNAKLRECAKRHEQTLKRNNSLRQFLNIHSESLCPCGWKVHNQNCYKFSTDIKDWNTAKQECESLRSHLIIINTPEEE